MNKAAFFAIPLFNKTSEENKLSYEQLLHCTADEILNNNIPSKDIINLRIKDCTILLDCGKLSCLTGIESQKLIDYYKEEITDVKEFKGNIANRGHVKGNVKLIHNKNDFFKINDHDILVTSMTTPEMVPIMKKASAIVTDEGGITCHAAIISREMNKPCIIGTKIASKVLHDGDYVEVDANNGIVRIIERAKK
jgi:phosphohistidine swiveling domain-containing protein